MSQKDVCTKWVFKLTYPELHRHSSSPSACISSFFSSMSSCLWRRASSTPALLCDRDRRRLKKSSTRIGEVFFHDQTFKSIITMEVFGFKTSLLGSMIDAVVVTLEQMELEYKGRLGSLERFLHIWLFRLHFWTYRYLLWLGALGDLKRKFPLIFLAPDMLVLCPKKNFVVPTMDLEHINSFAICILRICIWLGLSKMASQTNGKGRLYTG